MNYQELARKIFADVILFIEASIEKWGITANDEFYLERLTYLSVVKAREFKSPIIMIELKKILREYLSKYSPYQADKDDLIDIYMNAAKESITVKNAQEKLLMIDFNNIANIEENSKELQKICSLIKHTNSIEIHDGFDLVKDNLKNGLKKERIESRIQALDNIVDGFGNGEMIIIAGRPGTGKTAFSCQIIANLSKEKNIAFFSAEMSAKQIMNRILSSESSVDSKKLESVTETNYEFLTHIERDRLVKAAETFEDRIIKIVDKANIEIDYLVNTAFEIKKDFQVDIIVIDYLQLLTVSQRTDRREQIVTITRKIKGLARDLDIPVLALAQLNRDADQRRPVLKDLKESGSIEEDADTVIFLHSTDYEEIETRIELIVAKNRSGRTGSTMLKYLKPINKFKTIF